MKAKKYIKLFLYIVVAFSLFHFVIWNLFTKYIFDIEDDYYIGDAGRMSYQVDSLFLRKNENNLAKKHINFDINEKNVDVITIGDSFSNGIVQGKNPFYQDYIATLKNLKVMNIQNPTDNFIDAIIKLHKLGVLKNMGVKHIIIESVERNSYSLSNKVNLDNDVSNNYLETITRPFFKRKFNHSIINRLNYNAFLYNIFYKYDSNAYKSKIYKLPLKNDFFTVKNGNILLCYKDDIDYISKNNYQALLKLNDNLNLLQKVLNKNNIKLHFMLAVDKYNLYSKYIQNNNLETSNAFEDLRSMKKDYNFIDTKKILEEKLDSGVKDLYYSDDTHWSYISSQLIVNKINFHKVNNE